jgi:hypothetical protein
MQHNTKYGIKPKSSKCNTRGQLNLPSRKAFLRMHRWIHLRIYLMHARMVEETTPLRQIEIYLCLSFIPSYLVSWVVEKQGAWPLQLGAESHHAVGRAWWMVAGR